LTREARSLCCPAGHSYDLAKEGYVNLLSANHRHSASPGDDREMVAARTRFLDGGWYAPLRERLCGLAEQVCGAGPVLLDAGCGEGYYTAALCETLQRCGGRTAGVDLSKAAVKRAAKRCPSAEIAVSSVYRLPVPTASADLLVNCFSPLAAEEFARVLKPGGTFLYVVPGPRHLWELKTAVYDHPYENEVKDYALEGFTFINKCEARREIDLDSSEDIQALFGMTPYAYRTGSKERERLQALTALSVRTEFEVLIYQK
jgi:23S rRNA (guanine745-N1)-methyltransferase